MTKTLKLAIGSLVVGLVVLGLKSVAYWMTGSIALLSDALESTVNVATAIAAILAVRLANEPADSNHPYGHYKAEYFSAVLEGVMIALAAILILRESYSALLHPKPLDAPLSGLLVNGAASVVNGLWCWILIRQGRRLRSPALVADGRHLLSDVVSSVGVAFGVLLAIVTRIPLLDPALAILVALNILWSGWQVMKESLGGLMDEAVPANALAQIKNVISAEGEGALEAHDLRTRSAGRVIFIDFHLVVPGEMTVSTAHEICDRIEDALKAEIQDAFITIHVEPESKAKHSGIVVI
jgi:cation diffusion facilitator family transporter